jgi:hypothetical protein
MSADALRHAGPDGLFRTGFPERLPDGFTVTKPAGDDPHVAVCEVWTHHVGWELRLIIDGNTLPTTTVVQSADDMRTLVQTWNALMLKNGWT